MPPPTSVLLTREVFFEHDAEAYGGGGGIDRRARVVPTTQDIEDAFLTYLRILKPDAHFANPPEVSYIRLLRPTHSIPWLCDDITDAFIASADKNLVALYAGPYRPGTNLKGGYLIYDDIKNSLSTIPQPPFDYDRAYLGLGAVVTCLEEGAYVLGELTKVGSGHTQAALYTWQLSTEEWVLNVASFPPELCPPNHVFQADMCFSYRGSILCWVDLFIGMLVCDLRLVLQPAAQLEFRFVPLPKECSTYNRGISCQEPPVDADWFRSIACVGGRIKLVTMDGYCERPASELWLTIWTLSPDFSGWSKSNECLVSDIWASESHLSLGLPKILPLFPVVSMDEDDVVYLVFTDVTIAVDGLVDTVEYKGQYLLRVDMQQNKVSHHPQSTEQICSQLFASDCCAFLPQGLKGNQGKVKTRKVAASGKRVLV